MPAALTLPRALGVAVLGLVVAFVGTAVHRLHQPVGLVLALAIVLSAAVLTRAWSGWRGVLLLGLVHGLGLLVLSRRGPGGDVLIAAQTVGDVWFGGVALVPLSLLLPRRWFADRPLAGSRRTERQEPVPGP